MIVTKFCLINAPSRTISQQLRCLSNKLDKTRYDKTTRDQLSIAKSNNIVTTNQDSKYAVTESTSKPPPVEHFRLEYIPVEYHGVGAPQTVFHENFKWYPIYKQPHIIVFRSIIRLKMYLTFCSLGVCALKIGQMMYLQSFGPMSSVGYLSAITAASLLFVGSYARRIVCQIYASEDLQHLRICRLTFSGNRLDMVLPVNNVKPLTENNRSGRAPVLKLDFYAPDKIDTSCDSVEFYEQGFRIPLLFGGVTDREKFVHAFGDILSMKPGS